MAIPTKARITYTCGHRETRDLSDTPAGKRKSKAQWFAKNFTCTRCFKDSRTGEAAKDANQRALDAEAFAEQHGLPELTGSQKQVFWASILRHETLAVVLDGHERSEAVTEAAQRITWAGWWMDNLNWKDRQDHDYDAEDFAELILSGPAAQAERDETHVETENPY